MARVLLFAGAAVPLLYFATRVAALGAPLFGAFALKGRARWIVLACFAATVAIVAVASGVGDLANAGNAGLFSRLASLVLFPGPAVLCWSAAMRAREA